VGAAAIVMLTHAPLPTWSVLGRALLHRAAPMSDLVAPWRGDGLAAGWLSRSAWSLALIALWRTKTAESRTTTMWVPDYFCNSALEAVRRAGVKLVFYPLTNALEPDLPACRLLAHDGKPDLFVLVHYFGRPTLAAGARDFCAHQDAWMIEDAAQILRPVHGAGVFGDFVLYSPHKHLPIPDGAVLVVRPDGPSKLSAERIDSFGEPQRWPAQLDTIHAELLRARRTSAAAASKWLVKRVLQKVGVRRRRPPPTEFPEVPSVTGAIAPPMLGPRPSGLARRLLAELIVTLGEVARQRQRNQLTWDALLSADARSSGRLVVAAERPKQREWTPYLNAYRVSSSSAESIHDDWQRRGIPVSSWPDLPPEVTANHARHENAWRLRHERLYLPVHQSLNANMLAKSLPSPQSSV
jgi:hypothetical protein